MQLPDTNNLYAFKDFTLDIREGVLLQNGKPVAITPKAFQLLSILIEHRGAVVDKEKLISEMWADSIVEEGNLAFTAQRLRKVLGDDAKTPIYIETVPKRGYRFIAEVSISPRAEEVRRGSYARHDDRRRALGRIGVGVVVVSLITLGWFLFGRNGIQTSSAPILLEPFKAERLSSTGNAVQAAVSPNGKLVAYTDQTGNGKWSVWLRQLSSAENIQILPPAELMYGGLAFSHDNNTLFMTREFEGRLNIYRINALGGVPTKLIEDTQGWISVSPDDTKISFVRCAKTADDFCSLFVADIDGRNERRLVTRAEPIRIGDNAFSPDGRVVAFAAGQSRTGSDDFQLLQVDLATGTESPLTSEKFFNIKSIEWLPDGSELLFTARLQSQQNFSIWKLSMATGAVAQLTRDDTDFSELSLDAKAGNLVVTKVENNFTVYMEAIGEQTKREALAPGKACSFAPDGRIVYQSNDRDIWIIDANGNNKRQLTSDPAWDVAPLVTGDGRYIVFSSNRTGINHVWRMSIDGVDQKQLTHTEGGHTMSIAPDGRTAYYRSDITRRLRKVDVESGVESELPEIAGFAHAFSTDGRLVASFVNDPIFPGELKFRVHDLTGKYPVRNMTAGENDTEGISLEWSSDGESVRYLIKRAGNYELWSFNVRTEKQTLIAKLGSEPVVKAMLAPDGKSIATVRGSWMHDAFLVTGLKF